MVAMQPAGIGRRYVRKVTIFYSFIAMFLNLCCERCLNFKVVIFLDNCLVIGIPLYLLKV